MSLLQAFYSNSCMISTSIVCRRLVFAGSLVHDCVLSATGLNITGAAAGATAGIVS